MNKTAHHLYDNTEMGVYVQPNKAWKDTWPYWAGRKHTNVALRHWIRDMVGIWWDTHEEKEEKG